MLFGSALTLWQTALAEAEAPPALYAWQHSDTPLWWMFGVPYTEYPSEKSSGDFSLLFDSSQLLLTGII